MGSFSKYGDIRKVKTTGASYVTAEADGQSFWTTRWCWTFSARGVTASEAMAKHDSDPMETYRDIIYKVANEKSIHPALIAAIISRESRAGEAIKNSQPDPGYGDGGKAFGLMQIDEGKSRVKPVGAWNSVDHLRQATEMLVGHICGIQGKKLCKGWNKEEQLKGGIAAYNKGQDNVISKDVDELTKNKDYANDVVARAQWFRNNGYGDKKDTQKK